MKRGIGFYVIVGLAALLGLAVFTFLQGLADSEQVVVAVRPLPVGARLYAQDVEVEEVHASAVLAGAFTTPDDVLGQLLSVPRLPGEQITADMVGSQAINAIASTLDADWRAVGVHVDKAQGVAGVLRPGDHVDVVGVIESGSLRSMAGYRAIDGEMPPDPGVLARVVLVPQSFRYVELPEGGDEEVSVVQASAASSRDGDLVLAVPATPITFTLYPTAPLPAEEITGTEGVVGLFDEAPAGPITPTVFSISPVELLVLLDHAGQIHLALAPDEAVDVETPGLALRDLIIWLTPRQDGVLNPEGGP